MRYVKQILLASALCCVSCNGMFDGIYDVAPAHGVEAAPFSTVSSIPNRMTLSIDATDYGKWHYVSLKNRTVEECDIPISLSGEWDGTSGLTYNEVRGDRFTALSSVKTDAQPEPEDWDFAIHHFDVKTKGGAVAETPYSSLDELAAFRFSMFTPCFVEDVWSTTQVMVDLSNMMAFRVGYQNSMCNPVLSRWVMMDISTPPPTYAASGKVYVLRLADGSMAAMRLRSYMNERGVKGHLTIDIIYPFQ